MNITLPNFNAKNCNYAQNTSYYNAANIRQISNVNFQANAPSIAKNMGRQFEGLVEKLEKGVNLNLEKNEFGQNVVMQLITAINSATGVEKICYKNLLNLVIHAAKENPDIIDPDMKDNYGETAFHYACSGKDIDVMYKVYFDFGTNPFITDNRGCRAYKYIGVAKNMTPEEITKMQEAYDFIFNGNCTWFNSKQLPNKWVMPLCNNSPKQYKMI